MSNIKICPRCGYLVFYDSYFHADMCRRCGWMKRIQPTLFETLTKSPEYMAEVFAGVTPFSICDMVCGGNCMAIGSLIKTKREQCKDKIISYLNSSMNDIGENDESKCTV